MKKYPKGVLRTKTSGETPEKKLYNLILKWNKYENRPFHQEAVYITLRLLQKETFDLFKQYPDLEFEASLDSYEREIFKFIGYVFIHNIPIDMPIPKEYTMNEKSIKLWKI